MRINKMKLNLAMARACMNADDLQSETKISMPTIYNAISGRSVRPATLGRIAKALKVDVTEILED